MSARFGGEVIVSQQPNDSKSCSFQCTAVFSKTR